MARTETTLRYDVAGRQVTIKAMDSIGAEDCYDVLLRAVLHRYVTGEDLFRPTPREAKDWIIKLNLTI